MFQRPWDIFYKDRLSRLLVPESVLLDIGGGLRVDAARNNRIDPRNAWIPRLIEERKVRYTILDYVDTYHPDIVGDIQDLPLPDGSQDAIVCNAVLEHVENPIKAAGELYRTLRPGGRCFVYVPFLYYYHAERGYYQDYWRFTEDGLRSIFRSFSTIEIQSVRGPLETLIRLSPLGRWGFFEDIGYIFDTLFKKGGSKQTSGYFIYLEK